MLGKTKKFKKGQSGLVSLIVVSILAVVLGLVAVGFSKLMDRELGQSLNRELSTQAFYSALAGLDDARAYLGAGGQGFQTCDGWGTTSTGSLGDKYFTNDLSNGGNTAKYSCVTIDTQPNALDYQLKADQSVTFEVNESGLSQLAFSWENYPKPNAFVALGATGSLPQTGSIPSSNGTAATGLLEVNLYPVPQVNPSNPNPSCTNSYGTFSYGSDTNNTLACLSRTYYMYPNSGGGNPGSVSYSTASSNGGYVPGNCKFNNGYRIGNSTATARMCNTAVTGLTSGETYYVRLTARYEPIDVTVQAADSGNNSLGNIPGAQAVVDVTGQGTDVLQRIRARIDLNNSFQTPSYGVQSMASLCKGFDVEVQGPSTYGPATPDLSISGYNFNGACAIPGGTSGTSIPGASANELGPH